MVLIAEATEPLVIAHGRQETKFLLLWVTVLPGLVRKSK